MKLRKNAIRWSGACFSDQFVADGLPRHKSATRERAVEGAVVAAGERQWRPTGSCRRLNAGEHRAKGEEKVKTQASKQFQGRQSELIGALPSLACSFGRKRAAATYRPQRLLRRPKAPEGCIHTLLLIADQDFVYSRSCQQLVPSLGWRVRSVLDFDPADPVKQAEQQKRGGGGKKSWVEPFPPS